MAQGLETAIDHLRHAMVEAANNGDVKAARLLALEAVDGDTGDTRNVAYWGALAAATYAELPEGVRKLIGRKLVPGLREVNAELRRAIGKHLVLWMDAEHVIAKVTLEDARIPICTNCGGEYPDGNERCPSCGIA